MKKWSKPLVLTGLVVIAVWAVMMMIDSYRGAFSLGETPITPPPVVRSTTAATPTQPATVTEVPDPTTTPTPSSTVSEESGGPTPTPVKETNEPEPEAVPALADYASVPIHVEITRGDERLAGAQVVLTQLNDADELNPPEGLAGWYGPSQWPVTPGNMSERPAVIVGHVTYNGEKDVFNRLGEVNKGDLVTITYDDGLTATFVIDADALSVPKNDVIDKAKSDYRWVWELDEPGRKVSLFSCDPTQGRDGTGHSVNNWVVQATRIS